MQEGKTIGQLMEEMRQKAGAQNYHGHDYMDLQRFAENTRHMVIFDVLTDDSPVGWKGERTRLFLSDPLLFLLPKTTLTMYCVWAAIQTARGSVWLQPLKSRKPPLRLPRY